MTFADLTSGMTGRLEARWESIVRPRRLGGPTEVSHE
jgi:hypothetical protein